MSNESSSKRGGVAVAGGLGAALLSLFGLIGRQADEVGRVAIGTVGRTAARHVDDVGRIPMHHPHSYAPRLSSHGDDLRRPPRGSAGLSSTAPLDPPGAESLGLHDWDGYKVLGKAGGKAITKGGKLLQSDKEERRQPPLPYQQQREPRE